MSTENTSTETVNGTTEETSASGTENNAETNTAATTETVEGTEQTVTTTQQETRLPDDHPLVKAYARSQEQLKQLKGSSQARVTELETQVSELTAKVQTAEATQTKYDRLEAFLISLGGPISKALDSKSFSTALFESDTDIKGLVTQWHKDNPSATSAALNSGSDNAGPSKTMNDLLRSAAR